MFKKLLNNFRGCNRSTQALILFLVAIVIMTVLKKPRESLSVDIDDILKLDSDACEKIAENHFRTEKKTEKEWNSMEIGKKCNEIKEKIKKNPRSALATAAEDSTGRRRCSQVVRK